MPTKPNDQLINLKFYTMFGKKRNTSKTESTKNTPAKKPMLKTTAFTDREDLVNFINHNGINPDDFTIVGTQNFYTLFYY